MISTLVHIRVKPEHIEEFIAASKMNHENSIKEPGNRRFDILQSPTDPCVFMYYETYVSEQDIAEHKQTEHYLKWRSLVDGIMAEPRQAVRYNSLFPAA